MREAAPALGRMNARPALLAKAGRYSLSIIGPVAVSGAHFLASLLFVRGLGAADFGIFPFVLTVSAFAMSVTGAGLVLPATQSIVKGDHATTNSVFRMALVATAVFAILLTLIVRASGTDFSNAIPLGL